MLSHRYLSALILVFILSLYTPVPQTQAQDGDSAWLLNQINGLRGQLGLHAYVWNGQLAAAAWQQSQYMATTGHISHTQADGSTPGSRAAAQGYSGRFVSENIYGGSIAQASDAWNFWVNSPTHYAGLAHQRNNEIGIAVASGPYGIFFTAVFGYNSGTQAPPPANNNPPPAGDGNAGAPAPARTATTRPPTRTPIPTATFPTFTPSVTWTPTSTWTPVPTQTLPPDTATPIQLPTAAVVAIAPTLTPNPASAPVSNSAQDTTISRGQGSSAPRAENGNAPSNQAEDDNGLALWLVALIGAIIGLGLLFMGYGIYSIWQTRTP